MKENRLRKPRLKALRICLVAMAVLIFCGTLIAYYRHGAGRGKTGSNVAETGRVSSAMHEIRGFRFDATQDGNLIMSIRADRFAIEKKKIGFFRFGLMNEAIFDNAQVHIYGKQQPLAAPAPGIKTPGRSTTSGLSFDHVFSRQSLPPMPPKKIASVVMAPVEVLFYDQATLVSRVRAGKATLRLQKRDIVFDGGVKMVSDSRTLSTDQLYLVPETAMVRTDRKFIINDSHRQWSGERLSTDLFLTHTEQ